VLFQAPDNTVKAPGGKIVETICRFLLETPVHINKIAFKSGMDDFWSFLMLLEMEAGV
jgi:hypothetical protein